ncbi:MAG: DUF2147 domain-containing protein [Candidatus Kapabacteria bacterium]|nr:DUF2147 domain-containing protein [Candidatus Kapabacteria bacterium]
MHAVLFLIFIGMPLLVHAADNPDAILGEWIVGTKKAKITIVKENGKYVGRITWLREPNDESGKPKMDTKNPDIAKQSRPILGMLILWDFEFDDDEWVSGRIYAADDGKEYKCKMWMEGKELKVRGYVGISLLGRTDTWTRP